VKIENLINIQGGHPRIREKQKAVIEIKKRSMNLYKVKIYKIMDNLLCQLRVQMYHI
jgi:hypothetical protein